MVRFLLGRLTAIRVPDRSPCSADATGDPFRRKTLVAQAPTLALQLLGIALRQSVLRRRKSPPFPRHDIGGPAERKDSPDPHDLGLPPVIVPLHAWRNLLSHEALAQTAIKAPAAADPDPSLPASAPRLSALMIAMLG
jgi:hypothetical protein